jgi:hypothetical protein
MAGRGVRSSGARTQSVGTQRLFVHNPNAVTIVTLIPTAATLR